MLNRHALASHAYRLNLSMNTEYNQRAKSQQSFQSTLEGGAVFIQPPREQIDSHLLQYCHAKSTDSTLAALLLIPEGTCKQYTEGFQLLATYHPGHTDWITHPVETHNLWYDPVGHNPKLTEQLLLTLKSIPKEISPTEVERLNMLFQAQVAGQPCIALLDTGATNNFITEKKVEQAGLKINKDTSTVWGAGHTQLSTKGTVTLPLRVGQFKTRVTATVVETIVPGVEVVMGQAFQRQTSAIIDCGKNKTTLHHPCGRSCSIYPINHTMNTMCIFMEQAQQSAGPMAADVISAKAATKHLKKGAPYLLLHLTDTTPDTRIAGFNPSKPQAPVIGIAGHNKRTDHPDSHLETQQSSHTTGRVEQGQSHPHGKSDPNNQPPPALQKILDKHEAVFPADLPYGIPPDRDTGEAIPLLDHDKIPFRRNRRFTPQENQLCMEMVSDLLEKGLVTPSKS